MTTKATTKGRPDLISRAELARRKGVARSSVTRACAGQLARAVAGDMVDAAHPAVRKWLGKGARRTGSKARPTAQRSSRTTDEFTQLTLRKRRAEVEELERGLEIQAGKLISRELVRVNLFGAYEQLHQRLLGDFVVKVTPRVMSVVRSGAHQTEVIQLLRDGMSAELERTKRDATSGLRRCSTTGNPPDVQEQFSQEHDQATERAKRTSRQVDALVRAIAVELRTHAAPSIVVAVVKALARTYGGPLDGLLALLPRLEPATSATVATMLEAHVQRVTTRAIEGSDEQTQDNSR